MRGTKSNLPDDVLLRPRIFVPISSEYLREPAPPRERPGVLNAQPPLQPSALLNPVTSIARGNPIPVLGSSDTSAGSAVTSRHHSHHYTMLNDLKRLKVQQEEILTCAEGVLIAQEFLQEAFNDWLADENYMGRKRKCSSS